VAMLSSEMNLGLFIEEGEEGREWTQEMEVE
jgi:hypothetical protein